MLKAAEGMRLMINDGMTRRDPVLFCGLLDRFLLDQKQEQEAEQITHNTLASYRCSRSDSLVALGAARGDDSRTCLMRQLHRASAN